MAYQIGWYQPERILDLALEDDVSLEDARYLSQEATGMLAYGTPLVHVIVDLSAVTSFPTSLSMIQHMITIPRSTDNLGWVIICGARNSMLRFLATTLTQVAVENVRLHASDNIDDAIQFLYEVDTSLVKLAMLEPFA